MTSGLWFYHSDWFQYCICYKLHSIVSLQFTIIFTRQLVLAGSAVTTLNETEEDAIQEPHSRPRVKPPSAESDLTVLVRRQDEMQLDLQRQQRQLNDLQKSHEDLLGLKDNAGAQGCPTVLVPPVYNLHRVQLFLRVAPAATSRMKFPRYALMFGVPLPYSNNPRRRSRL